MKPIQFLRNAPALLAIALGLFLPFHARAAVQHVIQISVDGLRGDLLEQLVETMPENFPAFTRLQNEGVFTYNARCDFDYSVTVPNHACMVTGRPVSQPDGSPNTVQHGFDTNFPQQSDTLHNSNPNVSYISSIFDVTHDRGLSTAYYVGKTRLRYIDTSYDAINGAPDLVGDDDGTDKIDNEIVQNGSTQLLVDAILNDLATTPINYTFLHITDPDSAGHSSGWISLDWSDAVIATDGFVGQILSAIDDNPALAGQVAVVITADHGGGGGSPSSHTDSTAPENYTIPFFMWGPGIPANRDIYDFLTNREDPGSGRPSYSDFPQPLRDGDAPNLSLFLLGLPPIPGSFMLPEIAFGGTRIETTILEEALQLSWPASPPNQVLETASDLLNGPWTTIDSGIETQGNQRVFTVFEEPTGTRYYRLRTLPFSITTHPASVDSYPESQIDFHVATSGESLSYQWQFNGEDIVGATNPTFSIPSVTVASGGDYRVLVTDGNDTITSDVATLEVLLNPIITQQPLSTNLLVGGTAIFEVTATSAGSQTYQWKLNGDNLPDASSSTLVITNITLANQGDYSVIVSDAFGSTESLPASLLVLVRPTIIQHPLASTVNTGEDASFTVSILGNPPPYTYRWRRSGITVLQVTTDATTSTLSIPGAQLVDQGNYDVIITNPAAPSPGIRSRAARLTVTAPE